MKRFIVSYEIQLLSSGIVSLLLLWFILFSRNVHLSQAAPASQTSTLQPPPMIQVKFVVGTDTARGMDLLPDVMHASILEMRPLFTLSPQQLDLLRVQGLQLMDRNLPGASDLPDLNMWYQLTLDTNVDLDNFVARLNELDVVDVAELAPLPAPPSAITSDFTGNQGYVGPATDGIDAQYSWLISGGNGAGVTIYDVEYAWNQTHEDLSKANGIPLLLNPGDTGVDPFPETENHHGTAVLGQIIADNDSKGITGISWGSDVGMAPANTANLWYNPANAILLAIADGQAGDVILIEQQTVVCGITPGVYGPLEWWSAVFDVIQTATANGFIVVEAAGNGSRNLDGATCLNLFNRSVRDSGAIIVGAGGSPDGSDLKKLSFSSYGSRVDVQGWGNNVMTTGYGYYHKNADALSDRDFWYTSSFGGTSSASPMVAGAAANLQGIAKQNGMLLTPAEIRDLLVATGTPQRGSPSINIGPRPNLKAAIAQQFPPNLTLSQTVSPADPMLPGELMTYTLSFSNTGIDFAVGITLSNEISSILTDISIKAQGVTITDTGASPGYVWEIEDLAQNEGGKIVVRGTINPTLLDGTHITNTAQIYSMATEKTLEDNTSEADITIFPAPSNLALSQTVVPSGPILPGEPITYTLSFSNTDMGFATSITLSDEISSILTNISIEAQGVTITDTGASPGYVWEIEDLAQNEGGKIVVRGRVNPAWSSGANISNIAQIFTTGTETVLNDNRAEVDITILAVAYLPVLFKD